MDGPHQSEGIHNQLGLHLPTRCFVDMYFVAGNHPGYFKIPCAVSFNDLIPGCFCFCQEPIIEAPRVKKVVEKGCFLSLMHDAKNLS